MASSSSHMLGILLTLSVELRWDIEGLACVSAAGGDWIPVMSPGILVVGARAPGKVCLFSLRFSSLASMSDLGLDFAGVGGGGGEGGLMAQSRVCVPEREANSGCIVPQVL